MYEEFFGLAKKPFQLSPDASFFFPSAEHAKALSFLQYGLSQGDGFIVITGSVGTGKTTLVQALVNDLDQSELSVATIVTSNLGESDLLQMVANNFGVAVRDENKATLLQELQHNFIQQTRANRRILLIVDEAQNLPGDSVEELRMLSNFMHEGKPLVQIFLLGQQEFRGTLLSEGFEQLRQRVIATYHLNPLSMEETRTYIEHRLHVAGWQSNPEISDDAFVAIHRFSEGVPRRINNVCDRLLLFAFLEELTVIDESIVESVSQEIGTEFWGGNSVSEPDPAEKPAAAQVFDTPESPRESAARSMFDKADVQRRIGSLERAVDGLGHSIKPELAEIREELSFLRLMMDDILHEMREIANNAAPATKKKRA
ncbi:MAG: AAA family ATPase [Pseudomonadales bacterium]|nr:AAA family ATPase [Pseudomonadales bacterium]